MCLGWKLPEAPISAVKPATVETGSSRPLRTDSSKLPRRLEDVMVAGAEAESTFFAFDLEERGCVRCRIFLASETLFSFWKSALRRKYEFRYISNRILRARFSFTS